MSHPVAKDQEKGREISAASFSQYLFLTTRAVWSCLLDNWNPLSNLVEIFWDEDGECLVLHSLMYLYHYFISVYRAVCRCSSGDQRAKGATLAEEGESKMASLALPQKATSTANKSRAPIGMKQKQKQSLNEMDESAFRPYNAMESPNMLDMKKHGISIPHQTESQSMSSLSTQQLLRSSIKQTIRQLRQVDEDERDGSRLISGLQGMFVLWLLLINIVLILSSHSAGFSFFMQRAILDSTLDKFTEGPSFFTRLRFKFLSIALNWSGGSMFAMGDFLPVSGLLFTLGYQLAQVLRHTIGASAFVRAVQEHEQEQEQERDKKTTLPSRYYCFCDLIYLGAARVLPALYTSYVIVVACAAHWRTSSGGAANVLSRSFSHSSSTSINEDDASSASQLWTVLSQVLLLSNFCAAETLFDPHVVLGPPLSNTTATLHDSGVMYLASRMSSLYSFPSSWVVMVTVQTALIVLCIQTAFIAVYNRNQKDIILSMLHAQDENVINNANDYDYDDEISVSSSLYRYEKNEMDGQKYRLPAGNNSDAVPLKQIFSNTFQQLKWGARHLCKRVCVACNSNSNSSSSSSSSRSGYTTGHIHKINCFVFLGLVVLIVMLRVFLAGCIIPAAFLYMGEVAASQISQLTQAAYLAWISLLPFCRLDAFLCGMLYYYGRVRYYSIKNIHVVVEYKQEKGKKRRLLVHHNRRKQYVNFGAVPMSMLGEMFTASNSTNTMGKRERDADDKDEYCSEGAESDIDVFMPEQSVFWSYPSQEVATAESETDNAQVDDVWYERDPFLMGDRFRLRGGAPVHVGDTARKSRSVLQSDSVVGSEEGNNEKETTSLLPTQAQMRTLPPMHVSTASSCLLASLNCTLDSLGEQIYLCIVVVSLTALMFTVLYVNRFSDIYLTVLQLIGIDTSNGIRSELIFRACEPLVLLLILICFLYVAQKTSRINLPLGLLLDQLHKAIAAPFIWIGLVSSSNTIAVTTSTTTTVAKEDRGVWHHLRCKVRVFIFPLSWLFRNPLFMILSSSKLLLTSILMQVPSIYLVLHSSYSVFASIRENKSFSCFGPLDPGVTTVAQSYELAGTPLYENQWMTQEIQGKDACNLQVVLHLLPVVLLTNLCLALLLTLLVEMPVWRCLRFRLVTSFRDSHIQTSDWKSQTQEREEKGAYTHARAGTEACNGEGTVTGTVPSAGVVKSRSRGSSLSTGDMYSI